MNAVEIDAAISALALQPFDAAEFPFAFLAAFGNKDTTIKRLRSGNNNASDLPGGVLQRNNIHLAVCETGSVGETIEASRAHQFREMNCAKTHTLILPGVSSEGREYLPVVLIDNHSVVSNLAFALYDAPRWNMALIASRLHLVWVGTVCGKLKTDYRYSNT
ncbi:MAG: hypothetical protein JNJ60_13225, partial [Rhodocyclaceae bacterium]|nr:hypothetical protein [Rhodocyclaceae bacterium]